jgi:hypothetical protein
MIKPHWVRIYDYMLVVFSAAFLHPLFDVLLTCAGKLGA